MEREVDEMQTYSKFPHIGHTCSPELGKRTWHLPFRYRDSLLPVNLVISGFAGLSAERSFEGRDYVDTKNLPGLWLTHNYLDWSYLVDYRLVFKTISL